MASETAMIYGGSATFTYADQRPDSEDTAFRNALANARAYIAIASDMAGRRLDNPTWNRPGPNTTTSIRDGSVERQMLKECFLALAAMDKSLLTEGIAEDFTGLVRSRAKNPPAISPDMLGRELRDFKRVREIYAASIKRRG